MNAAHLHLLINHAPLFTVVFGTAALFWYFVRPSKEIFFAAIFLFIAGGITAIASDLTGDQAEKIVEKVPDVLENLIENHEEAAEWAVVMANILAVAGIFLGILSWWKPQYLGKAVVLTLIIAVMTSGAMARTSYLGGQIRHTEIRSKNL